MIRESVVSKLSLAGFFGMDGVYVVFDGQFGSTGKGLAADLLEQYDRKLGCRVSVVSTNAGPNSGHTAILEDGTRVFTQQIPVFSACRGLQQTARQPATILNGGSVLDMDYVFNEALNYSVEPIIHASAAIINDHTKRLFDTSGMDSIASTGKGVGQAMAAKVLRMPKSTYGDYPEYPWTEIKGVSRYDNQIVLLECAQGFSLGPNSGFFPFTTSRECSVAQAMADAGAPPSYYRGAVMCIRTYPIRVGNTDKGNSGPCYPDQKEISWDDIGVSAELTSVTKRVRRVFTFSMLQFEAAYHANKPSVVFLNFCNYMDRQQLGELLAKIDAVVDFGTIILLGFGPKASDVITLQDWEAGK